MGIFSRSRNEELQEMGRLYHYTSSQGHDSQRILKRIVYMVMGCILQLLTRKILIKLNWPKIIMGELGERAFLMVDLIFILKLKYHIATSTLKDAMLKAGMYIFTLVILSCLSLSGNLVRIVSGPTLK